jgi:phenylacetate-coenzyme A ligase PaaK-like adenylate-forming protein
VTVRAAVPVADIMMNRVPALRYDRDEWTTRMMRWHFSDETGSPFWLGQRAILGFDPLRDVRDFDSLSLFGFFDKEKLRLVQVRDLIPRGLAGRPFRVFETGGSTGSPCRIVSVTRTPDEVQIYRTMLEARGVDGGDVLAMTPSGPHDYGYFVAALADTWHGATYFIDFDPRWVKAELRNDHTAHTYVKHLVAQTVELLVAQRPRLLFTTSKLLLALAAGLDEPLAAYGVRAVCTGGTSCTAEESVHLREEYLGGVEWIDTYGNTLFGHALQADPVEACGRHSYHLPQPLAVMRIVDPGDPLREVAYGERGRVLSTTLLEDLFLPNLLERDSAVRVGPHPWFPWDGVTDVQVFAQNTETVTEGVY